MSTKCLDDGRVAKGTQIAGDLVGQHLFQAQAEKMPRVAAVRTGGHVASCPRGPARAAVTKRTAIRQAGADGDICIQIAHAIAFIRTLSLGMGIFSLEKLAPAPNRAERIPLNVENRGTRRVDIPAPCPDFICQRFVNSRLGVISGLRVVRQLCQGSDTQKQERGNDTKNLHKVLHKPSTSSAWLAPVQHWRFLGFPFIELSLTAENPRRFDHRPRK